MAEEMNTVDDQSPTKSSVSVIKREGKKGRIRTTSKVRFPEDVHEPDILVSRETNGTIDVNVGFLQSQHKYEASFTIEDNIKDDIEVPTDQQVFLRVNNIYPTSNGIIGTIILGQVKLSSGQVHVSKILVLGQVKKYEIPSCLCLLRGSGHDVVMEIHAHKEGVWSEQIQLSSKQDNNNQITLVIHARVMDKEQGHPLLKEGIHCLGTLDPTDSTDSSDASDWKGFD